MLLSEFSQAGGIIACPRTKICNNCEQSNLLGVILNAGDNIDYQEDYGFRGSYFNPPPCSYRRLYKNKYLNMLTKNLIPQRNTENNDKQ